MDQKTQDILYKIDRTIRPVFGVTTCIGLLFMVVASLDTPIKSILTYIFYACACVWGVLLVCRLVLSPFVKSEEEEDFENKLDYILQKRQMTQFVVKPYNPLLNLTPDEEEAVKNLIRTLPDHPQKPGHINLAMVAQYLTALSQLNKANLQDKHHLRLWIAEVTQKKVPSSSQFNEAIPSRAVTKISAARKELEAIL